MVNVPRTRTVRRLPFTVRRLPFTVINLKVFSFVPTSSLKKAYSGLILKYRRYDSTIEFLKIGVLVTVLLIASLLYLYYVNRSSTRGYFLRQET